jgi:Tol biopolymer transport system component
MSPEQAEGRPLDARSDIFSFGVVLYEVLTGRRPFAGDSDAGLVSAILRDAPPPARSLRPELPDELDRVLARALEKDVERRYQRISDASADLRSLLGSAAATRVASRPVLHRPSAWAIAFLIVVALGVIATRGLRSRKDAAPLQFRLLSTFPGSHRSPSLSPDGRMLAFVDDSHDTPQVWVKPVGEGDPVQITSGEVAAARPRWSPKGDLIVFERRGAGLWSVPPLGGSPRQILDGGGCASFFPDGERVVYDRGAQLWVARVDGSDAHRVEGVPDNFYSFYLSHCAAVSPDGQWLAFFQPHWGPHGDYWTIPASGGTARRLTFDVTTGGGVVFARDGLSLIVSSGRAGSQTLWRVPTGGGAPEAITTGAGEDFEPELSADGRMLVYSNVKNEHAIMLLDTKTGAEREVLARRAHTNGAVFSPDGRRIAFFSKTEENEQLFTVGTDGRDLRQVTRGLPGFYIMPRWSPDASSLYFFTHDPASFRRVSSSGGAASTVVEGWFWGTVMGAWLDPAGRSVAFNERLGSKGGARIRDLATGEERALGRAISVQSWTRDGSAVLGHVYVPDGQILRCPRNGGPCAVLGTGFTPVPSADGSQIFFERRGRSLHERTLQSIEAWVMSAEGKDSRRLATLEVQSSLATRFDVSPRDELVWVQFRRGKAELWLAQLPN